MTCVHLKELFQLVERNDIKLGSSDLIRLTCSQCGVQETCPSRLMEEGSPPVEDDPAGNTGDQAGNPLSERQENTRRP